MKGECAMGNKIVSGAALAAGLFLLADGLFLTAITNFNTGNILVLLAGVLFTAYGIWHKKIREKTAGGVLRIVKYVIIAVLLAELCLIGFLAYMGHRDSVSYEEDALVVLGAAVHGDQVSRSLAHRLDRAAEYAEKNPGAVIVVTGGQGPQEDVTEAAAMETYLIGKGVSRERMIKEERATSTYENFKFSFSLLRDKFGDSYTCAYITNGFHLYRAGKIADSAGVQAQGLGAATDWYMAPASYLRESLALIKFWLLGR